MNSTVRSQLLNSIIYSKDDLESISEYIIIYAYQFIKKNKIINESDLVWGSTGLGWKVCNEDSLKGWGLLGGPC